VWVNCYRIHQKSLNFIYPFKFYSNFTNKNESWLHFSWPTQYIYIYIHEIVNFVKEVPYWNSIVWQAADSEGDSNVGSFIALRPPPISASWTMGEAILLVACLTGLQGLRGPLGWELAEAAGTNNVVSKATVVDIAYRKPAPTEPEKTTVQRHFYHVLSLNIALSYLCLLTHIYS